MFFWLLLCIPSAFKFALFAYGSSAFQFSVQAQFEHMHVKAFRGLMVQTVWLKSRSIASLSVAVGLRHRELTIISKFEKSCTKGKMKPVRLIVFLCGVSTSLKVGVSKE